MTLIAVIDDDRDFLTLVRDALGDVGWETVTCADTTRAVSVIKETRPDGVLLDLRFHALEDGWDILTALQLHPTLHAIPVVLCSGAVEDLHDRMEWLQRHDIRVLAKPFSLDDLYLVLSTALSTRGQTVTAIG